MSSRSSTSDPNGLCLTTSNTSSLTSNSSNSTSISNISNKFKNALNRKRSQSFIIPEKKSSTLSNSNSISSPNVNIRKPLRNRSLGSIQFSPSQASTPTFENLNIPPMTNHHNHTPSLTQVNHPHALNHRSNSTSTSISISDSESINIMDISPRSPTPLVSPLFKIDEKLQNHEIKINNDEEFFDDIADGILERINKTESKIDWSI
ncbi:hypothetical protein BN7_4084 [Wickerhamomyces ciferrii]|uniref:Uncharacterized protein n=1 Tax=Wickerhamomyces ciferrii (strain ATCC 14091 / BCRC 22168 / CBS 111 / JCM 3599 / NBRC 0793 / NRRL Y-1031 F-60-10) TaxID=1206466 RepID=K0KT17_WICCF|nr:uncharacterized protein BN7_4084 [Wickerhamomyces ciferrii]CCH44519.1 hypothetical protein BN7_4084 [Wickerhamomyces ciferrii]